MNIDSVEGIRLQLLLAGAMRGIDFSLECDTYHAPPDDGTKCMECNLPSDCHSY